MIRALLIDDDEELARLLREYLATHQVELEHAATGPKGLERLARPAAAAVDVVLLDVMLPGMDGFAVCRTIRETRPELPILMLTARGDDNDRIVGLELGADDYVPKPYNARELLARMKAVLRRTRGGSPQAADVQRRAANMGDVLEVGDLRVDVPGHAAALGEKAVPLTSFEFRVLVALARRAGETVTREELAAAVKGGGDAAATAGYDPSVDRSLDVHISHLRQKLGDDPRDPRRIRTVRGVGYVLVQPAR
ncbi:response regulator transcription factor [Pendulispora brunnea]|uniref:Response regulator transcription factor n=1 Tax=Pendulispora brunnea TaxID=2905690 RepID=A0ABZ2KCQ2_9BACT